MRRYTPWILLTVAIGLLGCSDSLTTDSTALPPPPAPGDTFAVFSDPNSDFQTTDVRDTDNEVVRFDTTENALVWTPSDLLFDGWVVDGNFLDPGRQYQVRFGTVNGETRAYFTETGRGTICELSVVNNELFIAPTDLLPPR